MTKYIDIELFKNTLNEHFQKHKESFNPVGLMMTERGILFLDLPLEISYEHLTPAFILECVKILNSNEPESKISGCAYEVFFQSVEQEKINSYKYGKMNDNNAGSAIVVFLQERISREKTVLFGLIKSGKITNWIDNPENIIGDLWDIELYE